MLFSTAKKKKKSYPKTTSNSKTPNSNIYFSNIGLWVSFFTSCYFKVTVPYLRKDKNH